MQAFGTARQAKEFLIDCIVQECCRKELPLSDVERKMLYFSEEGWTLADIEDVSSSFEADYDQPQYEQKMAGIISGILQRWRAEGSSARKDWDSAVKKLRTEDHYLLVLVDAGRDTSARSRVLKIVAVVFGIACLASLVLIYILR